MHPSRRWPSLLLCLSLGLPAVAACGDDDPAGNDGSGSGPGIQGTVSRQKTGEGVAGVTLAVARGGQVVDATATGPDGTFALAGLADGSYQVVPVGLELAGLDPRFDVMEPGVDTAVVSGGTSQDLVFAVVGLVPARITGEVTCGGTPSAGATVRVAGGRDVDETVMLDAVGRYAVLELLAGVYAVVAESPDCDPDPSVVIVELRPGEFARVDFAG